MLVNVMVTVHNSLKTTTGSVLPEYCVHNSIIQNKKLLLLLMLFKILKAMNVNFIKLNKNVYFCCQSRSWQSHELFPLKRYGPRMQNVGLSLMNSKWCWVLGMARTKKQLQEKLSEKINLHKQLLKSSSEAKDCKNILI